MQMASFTNVETSAEGSEVALVEEYKEKDKKTLDSYVPNAIITCTADDDIDLDANALDMIYSFNFPTADEVFVHTIYIYIRYWRWSAGVVSNISQCQITRITPLRVRDLAKSRTQVFIYLIFISSVTVMVRIKVRVRVLGLWLGLEVQ